MSDLWFNIRFGRRHFQWTRDWKISFRVNSYYVENKPDKWFAIYSIFGVHL